MITSFGLPQFGFLLTGLQWTLVLTAIALVGGGIAGLAIALARVARSPWLWRSAAGYIALFQGTPLLMQLFVVYYGLGLLGLKLPAWAAVAIGFTLNASAFLGDIWRGAIQAVPHGQAEAASALGLRYAARMRHVVLRRPCASPSRRRSATSCSSSRAPRWPPSSASSSWPVPARSSPTRPIRRSSSTAWWARSTSRSAGRSRSIAPGSKPVWPSRRDSRPTKPQGDHA